MTRGADNTPLRLSRLHLPADLSGLSVLDIGAWDGFFSFEAERCGAARVVATDYYSWHGLGWGTGQGKAGFELAREVLGSRVEDVDLDVMDLSAERIGRFDLVLFLGVLYHLPNPLLALERVASVTANLLVMETVVDMVGFGRPAAAFYPGRELNGDPTNWWGPNAAAVHGMLQTRGIHARRHRDPGPVRPLPRRPGGVSSPARQEQSGGGLSSGSRGVPRLQDLIRAPSPCRLRRLCCLDVSRPPPRAALRGLSGDRNRATIAVV